MNTGSALCVSGRDQTNTDDKEQSILVAYTLKTFKQQTNKTNKTDRRTAAACCHTRSATVELHYTTVSSNVAAADS